MKLQWRAISSGDVRANSWRKQETSLIIDLSTCLSPTVRVSVQYLFTQLQKARIVYTGVDLQGPINSAFTEPVITNGARTLGYPLRRVPSAGSFTSKPPPCWVHSRNYPKSEVTVKALALLSRYVTSGRWSFPQHPWLGLPGRLQWVRPDVAGHGNVMSRTKPQAQLFHSLFFWPLLPTHWHSVTHIHTR